MRKYCFLLAILMLASCLITACNDAAKQSSQAVSQASSAASSSIPEESSRDEKPEEEKELLAVRENPLATVVSAGASYAASPGANETYPDPFGTKLTDGLLAPPNEPSYMHDAFAGYVAGSGQNIILDLGQAQEKLYQFRVSYLDTQSAGIAPLGSVTVYISDDSKEWEKLGTADIPTSQPTRMAEAVLTLEHYVSARYVRFNIRGTNYWFFLDEISVIADVENIHSDATYLEAVKNAYQALGTVARPTSGESVDLTLNKTMISHGMSYEIIGRTEDRYPDDGKLLTDGLVGEGRVSLAADEDVSVRISLGSTVTDIASLEATFFSNATTGIYLPVALKVAAIDEGGNRTELGILYASTTVKDGAYTFSLPLSKTVSAKEIEFTAVATDSKMLLAQEFAVYAYRAVAGFGAYPPVELDQSGEDWGSDATDDYVNLVSGTTQQIVEDAQIKTSATGDNTPVTSTLMTDGKTSGKDVNIHNGKYFKFMSGAGRTVIFDLGHISAMDKITASFTHVPSWGVLAPQEIQVRVTTDGKTWYTVGEMKKPDGTADGVYKYELQLKELVKARYVAIHFSFESWAGCDEVEIFGTTSVAKAKSPASAGYKVFDEQPGKRLEPTDELLGGAKDTCLLYQNRSVAYTEEDLLPYLAYLDKDGKPKDVMFDSFLFLYYGELPGGGMAHAEGTIEGWQWALEDLFADGKNIHALNSAAGKVKDTLGLDDDYRYKVLLTLYYPSPSVTDFGDVDGDGKTENLSKLSDRLKVLQWYIDCIDEAYRACGFEHIEFAGYYWFHEAINADDAESKAMLNAVSDMVHAKGKDFCWIPYFMANGFERWKKCGFDVAVMQPNYAFKLDAPYGNLESCARFTAKYGMGVEIEISYQAMGDDVFYRRYMEYLASGAKHGYMNDCIIMYYQERLIFKDACYSSGKARAIYDATYHFIKGDLQTVPDPIPDATFEGEKNAPITGTLPAGTDTERAFEICVAPDVGSLTLSPDGTFAYYPQKDFTGEVTFRLRYRELFDWSEPFDVTVTVK